MIVVVADTSPLRYLTLIGEVDVLAKLYSRVLIPASVADELKQARTPEAVRKWMTLPPDWIEIIEAVPEVPIATDLDAGERDAILLALERHADLVLMDDRDGVEEAIRQGLTVTGTLGVLDRGAEKGFLRLPIAFARLRETNFRTPASLLEVLLAQDAKRRATSA